MAKSEELSNEGERLRVFGVPSKRHRPRPASYWLRAGFLTFIGVLNLLAAIALFGSGVFLLTTGRAEGDTTKAELQLSTFSVHIGGAGPEGAAAAGAQHGRGALAAVCFVLSLVPFSIAVLARMQCQMAKEMALVQPTPEGAEEQG